MSLRLALPEAIEHLSGSSVVTENEGVVMGALRLLVSLAQAMVEGADGASVTLRRHGRLSTVAATDQTILDMDSEQYAERGRALHRCLDCRTLVPRRVSRYGDALANLYAKSKSLGYQRDSFIAPLGRQPSGRARSTFTAYGDCLRGAGTRTGRRIRH